MNNSHNNQRTQAMKVKTKEITVKGIKMNVPNTSTGKYPTERAMDVLNTKMLDNNNWKMATNKFRTIDEELMEEVNYALDWHLGGHEAMQDKFQLDDGNVVWVISSRGYYHYVGA